MHSIRWLSLAALCVGLISACGSSGTSSGPHPDGPPPPQCSDGIDNDGDGKIDYPNDPGCFAPQQDDETDDCPDGPMCPQCSNGKDDDNNGKTDYPDDPGCSSAADNSEYTVDPQACGAGVMIKSLPFNNEAIVDLSPTALNVLHPTCVATGIDGGEDVYLLHLSEAKVVVATTDTNGSTFDTIVYIRSSMCSDSSMEIGCSDDVSQFNKFSTVTAALDPGVYFVVVDSKSGMSGTYDLKVNLYDGVGAPCTSNDTCGPGLVCRVPMGQTAMVCSPHLCNDGVDDDGDGKKDYPDDPGCASPDDDDETDDCPSGPMCPECGDGRDNDGDGHIDYPADPSCKAASGTTEACSTTEGVMPLTMPMTTGSNIGATDDTQLTCDLGTGGKDVTYELDLPKVTSLNITVEDPSSFAFFDYALFGRTCGPTELSCPGSFTPITEGVLNAGKYYLVVDGEDDTQNGTFQIQVSGTIAGLQSCESPLAQSGALTCGAGFVCKGTAGARTCRPTQCNDGVDNNGDGKIDYPNDPGCSSASDDTETTVCPGANCPVCGNGTDDDGDTFVDYPSDFGCSSASGASEVFCALETDAVTAITAAVTTGTLATAHDNLTLDCGLNDPGTNDKTYVLKLPVPVETLTLDTFNSTITDTVLELWNTQCAAPGIVCNDDDFTSGTFLSSVTATGLPAGNYAVTVKAYDDLQNGAFKLNTHGIVAPGTPCGAALFTANVLKCETGTTCTGTPKKCQ